MGDVTFHLAGEEDLERTYRVFVAATNDYLAARNLPLVSADSTPPPRAMAFRWHILEHDARRFWVAKDADQVIGFGIAMLRGEVCYLADLQIIPAYQGRGIGFALLQRCLNEREAAKARIRWTITDATYPTSNGIYAHFGMYPWLILTALTGTLSGNDVIVDTEFAGSARQLTADPADIAALASVDREVLGLQRDADHKQWLDQPDMVGYLFGEPSRPMGYGYHSIPGRSYVPTAGAIGPVAMSAQQPSCAVNALSFLLARMQGLGVKEVRIKVPGVLRESIHYLLGLGLRFTTPQLILASEPVAQMERYAPSGSDALF